MYTGPTVTAFVYGGITNRAGFRINKVQLSALVYVATVANVLGDIAYFYALTRVAVVNVVLIGNLQPVFIVMMGFLVLKEERLSKYAYAGILVMVLAGVLVATGTVENLLSFRLGTYDDLIVLLATIVWSTTTIAFRKYLKELDAGVVAFYRFLFASLPLVAYVLFFSAFNAVSMYQVAIGVVVGVGTISYFEGLKRNKAAVVSALELTTPLFAVVMAFFALGESVGRVQIVGMLLLFTGGSCCRESKNLFHIVVAE
jgi:drug/metabolite transporter (DMT)-like permease